MITITISGSVTFSTPQGDLVIPYGIADSSIIQNTDKVYLNYSGTLTGSCLAGYSTYGTPMGTQSTGNKVSAMPVDLGNGGKLNFYTNGVVSTTIYMYYNGVRNIDVTMISGSDPQVSITLLVEDPQHNRAFIGLLIDSYPRASVSDLRDAFGLYASNTILPDGYPYNGYGSLYIDHNIFDIYEQYDVLPRLQNIFQSDVNATYNFFNGLTPLPDGYDVTYDLVGCTGDSNNPVRIPPNAVVTTCNFTVDTGYAFNSGSVWFDGSGFDGNPIQYVWEPTTGVLKIGVITSNITVHIHAYIDPYNDPNNTDLINGETDIPNADSISVPSLPAISAVSSGVIGLFNPSVAQMQLLSDFMWTDFGGTAVTTDDILKEIVQAIKRTISNPLDYIVGLNIIPSQGLYVGGSDTVRFGFVSSGVSMPRLTSQYFIVDCGSLSFDLLCGDTFLDYAPYSKFSLYLPYIGVKEMDANDFVGHTISIIYHGDVVTGGVTAYVLKDGSVMYQYSGCCALTVPINADSWGNTISGAVQIATSIAIGGMVGGAAGATLASAKGAADVASNPSLLSPQVLRSGAVSGGAGCMAVQKPFVIREAVRFHSTNGFNTVSGYPSYYYKALSEMHGFTSVLDVHLHGIPATDGEISEIESLLKEGVIL